MQHEAIASFALQCIDDLLIGFGTQSCHYQTLRFSTGKQCRTVCTRQYTQVDFDWTYGARVTTVDTWFAIQNFRTHHFCFEVKQDVAHFDFIHFRATFAQSGDGFRRYFAQCVGTQLFFTDLVRRLYVRTSDLLNFTDQIGIFLWRSPVPFWLATITHQVVNRVNRGLHLLMTIHHRAQHHVLWQLLCFRFHHQYSSFCTCHNQIHAGFFELAEGRVQNVLTVDVAHACRADWTGKWYARDRHRCRRCEQCRDIRVHFWIGRQYLNHHLNLVVKTFWEQRTQRTVDQTADQGFVFRWTAFTTEKTARNATC